MAATPMGGRMETMSVRQDEPAAAVALWIIILPSIGPELWCARVRTAPATLRLERGMTDGSGER